MPKKVLIVEDNELNMKLFADLLDAHGYETRQTRLYRQTYYGVIISGDRTEIL